VQFVFQEQYIDFYDHEEPIKYKLNDRYYSPLFPKMETKNQVFLRRGRIQGFEKKDSESLDYVKVMQPYTVLEPGEFSEMSMYLRVDS
jgi:hypothetical protein